MAFNRSPSPENLETLLGWLDPDRERASRRYMSVRTALVKMFEARGCFDPDHLADETIDRVMDRILLIAGSYDGDPTRYFYGVARNVLREHVRQPQNIPLEPNDDLQKHAADSDELEAQSRCLEKCLVELDVQDANFIRNYYAYEQHAKAAFHVRMATANRISIDNLRIRAFRIRKRLRGCLVTCIETI